MSSILLIIIGIVISSWATRASRVIESQRAIIFTGTLGGLIQIICQIGGVGLVIYGFANLFK